jgi:UDP-GlcNAc:undecaprenyl-phosphate/decaprenyl-phosphate GlcNAc-1-phosphate transferase
VALAVSTLLAFAGRWVGPRVGAMDHPEPGALKPHARPVPYLGGIALAGGVAAGLAVEGWMLPGLVSLGLFGTLIMGLVDDALGLPPTLRLFFQLGLGVAVVVGGVLATALPGRAFAWLGTVVLFAAMVNAVNMTDGMDGLAGGLGALSGVGIALVALVTGEQEALALVVAAAALGFLVHNLPPARLFLGDNGAYFLGAALAVVTLAGGQTIAALAGRASALGLFLLDLVLTVLRRRLGRRAILPGDRGHFYDQLLARGLSVSACLVVCYAIHGVLGGVGVAAAALPTAGALVVTSTAWAVAIAVLLRLGFASHS